MTHAILDGAAKCGHVAKTFVACERHYDVYSTFLEIVL